MPEGFLAAGIDASGSKGRVVKAKPARRATADGAARIAGDEPRHGKAPRVASRRLPPANAFQDGDRHLPSPVESILPHP
jgi:hypothetical protein